jgi:SH3-like domain-containing protein
LKLKTLILIILACLAVVAALLAADTYIVKVRTTSLRNSPKFYASAVTALKAGDGVEKVAAEGDWIQVKTAEGTVGWIHISALKPKKFNLLAMNQGLKTQATADEVALASKGFNKQVEDSYRARNKSLSFVWVDKMLAIVVPPGQETAFLKEGQLADYRGAK